MKHSRIYLGVTTILLSIAGVSIARHRNILTWAYYYTTIARSVSHCKLTPNLTRTTRTQHGAQDWYNNGVKIYLLYTDNLCVTIAYYNPD